MPNGGFSRDALGAALASAFSCLFSALSALQAT
jgi:hypothetical protein